MQRVTGSDYCEEINVKEQLQITNVFSRKFYDELLQRNLCSKSGLVNELIIPENKRAKYSCGILELFLSILQYQI